jgi:DNA-binding NarL/FixJ family response regulator
MPTTRVLLVDDHPLFRHGVRALLEGEAGLVIAGEVSSAGEAARAVHTLCPDVVLLEIQLFQPDGWANLGPIPFTLAPARVVILTANGSADVFLRAVQSGVTGYLLKDAPLALVVQAVQAAARGGEALLDPRLAPCLMRAYQESPRSAVRVPPCDLPARDQAILRLVADGYTNKEIGTHLHLAEKTVRNNLHRLFQRLHLTARAEAAAFAVQYGLTTLPVQPALGAARPAPSRATVSLRSHPRLGSNDPLEHSE